LYVDDEKWAANAIEAEGWVTYHKNLGIYIQDADAIDLKIPYTPHEPWIKVAHSFDVALQELKVSGAETILDLGAGRGWAAKEFARLGCRVVAMDVASDENVGLGRAKAIMEYHGVYFDRIIADGENLPFKAEKFDLVFCAAALHHFSNLPLLLQNVHKVLKPEGRLCAINEPCIPVFENEQRVLKRDAMAEIELGINETRPDILTYTSALQNARLRLARAFPVMGYQMNEADLRQWGRQIGAFAPTFQRYQPGAYLRQWGHFYRQRFSAWRNGRYAQAKQFLAQHPDELGLHILAWSSGELFLIATKQ
jgi:ubiquinone/menaquinone biosynthesis C-methylase UbiE